MNLKHKYDCVAKETHDIHQEKVGALWEIRDAERILYQGSKQEMEEVFEYLMTPIHELIDKYSEKTPLNIYRRVKFLNKNHKGNLRLIEVNTKVSS